MQMKVMIRFQLGTNDIPNIPRKQEWSLAIDCSEEAGCTRDLRK
jgi:hypothetical protein